MNPPLRPVDADVTYHGLGYLREIDYADGVDRTIIANTCDGGLEFRTFEAQEGMCGGRNETAAQERLLECIRHPLLPGLALPRDKLS